PATIALGVAAAVLGIAAVGLMRSRARASNSVAVLCFHNLSRDTADAYLADGLTEEITARLGHLARLDVKSRIAASRYCEKAGYEPAAIGRALGVANLVNGSVRRDGRRLRVTVELVGSRNGDRLWGGEFDRADADLLDIEQDIASADSALHVDSNAAEAWLARGRFLEIRHPRTYDGVIAAYQRASELDPRNAEVVNMIGTALRELGDDSGAMRAFHQALALEPD